MNTMDKLGQIRDRMDDMMIEEQAPKEEIESTCIPQGCNCCKFWYKIVKNLDDENEKLIKPLKKYLEDKYGKIFDEDNEAK